MRLALGILLLTVTAPALAADGIEVVLSGPAVPYERVIYAVEATRGTVVARVGKHFAAPFGRQERVGLLTRADLDALLAELDELGAFAIEGRPVASAAVRLSIDVRWGARAHRVTVPDPGLAPDGRAAAVLARVRAVVREQTEALPFHDAMLRPSEAGRLSLTTRPPARVRLDGALLFGVTPLRGLRVPAGPHVVVFEVDGGATHRYDVKVEVGRTTTLTVELK